MADKFEQFVRDMAALTTPDDPEEIAQMRADYAKNYGAKLESGSIAKGRTWSHVV